MEVLLTTVRGGAGEVLVVHAEQLADRRRRDRSPRPPRAPRRRPATRRGRRRHRAASTCPGRGPRAELRVSSTASSRTDQGVRREPLPVDRPVAGQRLAHHRHGRDRPRLARRATGASGRRPWTRRPRRPAAPGRRRPPRRRTRSARSACSVGSPSRRSTTRCAEPIQSGPAELAVAGRSPRGPRARPRRRGARRTRCRRRAASTARPRRSRARAGTSRTSPARTITAYAATRWRRGRPSGSGDMERSLGKSRCGARYFVPRARRQTLPTASPAPAPAKRATRGSTTPRWRWSSWWCSATRGRCCPSGHGLRQTGSTTSSTPGTSRRSSSSPATSRGPSSTPARGCGTWSPRSRCPT